MALTNTGTPQKPRLSLKSLLKISPKMLAVRRVLSKQKQLGLPEKLSFVLVPRLLDNNKVTFTSSSPRLSWSNKTHWAWRDSNLDSYSWVQVCALQDWDTKVWCSVLNMKCWCFYLHLERPHTVLWCPKVLIINSLTTNLAAPPELGLTRGSSRPTSRDQGETKIKTKRTRVQGRSVASLCLCWES